MKKLVYETIYDKLEKLGILKIKVGEYVHLKSSGYMDLVVEHQSDNVFTLTHYFEQAGDLCPDPDMEVRVFPEQRMAEALTYQDPFGYRCVYPEPDKVDIKAKKDLNQFLNKWLTNLINQGFKYDN